MKEEVSPFDQNPTENNQGQIERQKQIEALNKAKATLKRIRTKSSEGVVAVQHGEYESLFFDLIKEDLPEGLEFLSRMFVVAGVSYAQEAMGVFQDTDETVNEEEILKKLRYSLGIIGHRLRQVSFDMDKTNQQIGGKLIPDSPTGENFVKALVKFDMAACRAQVDPSLLGEYVDREEVQREYESLKDFFSQFKTDKEKIDYRISHVQESVQILRAAYAEFIETIKDTEEYKIDFQSALDGLEALIDKRILELKA